MPLRASIPLVGLALLGGCAGAPDATWRVPPTYGDAGAMASGPAVQIEDKPSVPLPPEAGTPTGPAGTAGTGASQTGYDQVGYASRGGDNGTGQPDGATAAHHTLPLGSFAEVTSLETGRTVLVEISGHAPATSTSEIDLSRAAADALGIDARSIGGVRVRAVRPSPADVAALRQGKMAAARLDSPEPVLRALRRDLPVTPAPSTSRSSRVIARTHVPPRGTSPGAVSAVPTATKATPRPGYTPSAPLRAERVAAGTTVTAPARPMPGIVSSARTAPAHTGFVVQVAAFSDEGRARKLARGLRGNVVPGGGVWRVRLGPFRDLAGAQAARDDAVRRGYGDAAIIMAP